MLNVPCIKIAVLSLADINNYGDVLFPYVFRNEIRKRIPNAAIELITNVEYKNDLYSTTAYRKEELAKYDAVILAGGESIQRLDEEAWNNIYDENCINRASDIIFDWLDLPKPYKAFFSVGVHPHMLDHSQDILFALKHLDYWSVRGELSKKIIERSIVLNYNQIRIVPDLGWKFNQYIDELGQKTHQVEHLPPNYMVFELFYESDEDVVRFVARELLKFQEETGVQVVLLPIVHTKSRNTMSSWNDYIVLSRINKYANERLQLMPDQLSFTKVGTILKNAKFYVGSSMHGAVTCLSYGKPAGNALTWTAPKLQDLHGARMRTDCFINHWGKLPYLLRRLNKEAEDNVNQVYAQQYSDYMRYRLDIELDELSIHIKNHVQSKIQN